MYKARELEAIFLNDHTSTTLYIAQALKVTYVMLPDEE